MTLLGVALFLGCFGCFVCFRVCCVVVAFFWEFVGGFCFLRFSMVVVVGWDSVLALPENGVFSGFGGFGFVGFGVLFSGLLCCRLSCVFTAMFACFVC